MKRSGRGFINLGLLVLAVLLLAAAQGIYSLRAQWAGGGQRAGGTLEVAVTPAAALYLDGQFAGISPQRLRLAAGAHLLEARLAGYRPDVRTVSADADAVEIALEPLPAGSIEVISEPAGSRVFADNTFKGYSPLVLVLPVGEHLIELEKAHHLPYQAWVDIRAGANPPLKPLLRDQILEFLLAAVESEPANVAHHTDLAHYYFINDRLEEAAAAYARAMEAACHPDAEPGAIDRLDKELKKHLKWPGKDLKSFVSMIEKAQQEVAQKYPGDARLLRERSNELLSKRDLEGALALWRQGVKANPGNPQILLGHATLAFHVRNADEAYEALAQAIRTAGGKLALLEQVAMTALQYYQLLEVKEHGRILDLLRQQMVEAILKDAGATAATRAFAWQLKARLFEEERDYQQAASAYAEAVKLQPVARLRAEWRGRQAEMLVRLGRREEAIELYRQAMQDAEDVPQKEMARRRLEHLMMLR